MIVSNANGTPSIRRDRPRHALSPRVGAAGVALGLLSALSAVHAAPSAGWVALSQMAATAVDPAKQVTSAVTVSNIDFKRGEGGSGKLILRFSGDGAMPDMRTQGANVVVDIGNASLPANLQRPLNVMDFATPVQRITASQSGSGAQFVLSTQGAFESMAYQSGRDYIVELVPRSESAKRAVGAVRAPTGPVEATATAETRVYTGVPVTFNFQQTDVRAILTAIAEEAKANVVMSSDVKGDMALSLTNVPWDQALDLVLQAQKLDKRRIGNVIWIAPQQEIAKYEADKADARLALENRAETVTEYIPVNYANAENIAKLLTDESKGSSGGGGTGGSGGGGGGQQNRGFLSPRGSLAFDARTNTLLVIDIPQRVADIKDLVSKLDRPVDQVVIEARIVIATESFARDLGAKFGISGASGKPGDRSSVGFGGNAADSRNNAINRGASVGPNNPRGLNDGLGGGLNVNLPSALSNAGSLGLSILNAGYLLDLELSALQTEGRGEVISNPRVVTSNQKEAVIRQGREIGYLTVTGGQSNNVPTVQFKEAFLELKVTPTITNDGRVFLNMNVKKDEQDGQVNLGAFGSVPTIAKREVNTAVLVDDGQTVVIGGVYEINDRSDLQKVPFLGDIPFLGNLFKQRSRSKQKAELLVFVTPKVMRVKQLN